MFGWGGVLVSKLLIAKWVLASELFMEPYVFAWGVSVSSRCNLFELFQQNKSYHLERRFWQKVRSGKRPKRVWGKSMQKIKYFTIQNADYFKIRGEGGSLIENLSIGQMGWHLSLLSVFTCHPNMSLMTCQMYIFNYWLVIRDVLLFNRFS